jgi:hypothetical protein
MKSQTCMGTVVWSQPAASFFGLGMRVPVSTVPTTPYCLTIPSLCSWLLPVQPLDTLVSVNSSPEFQCCVLRHPGTGMQAPVGPGIMTGFLNCIQSMYRVSVHAHMRVDVFVWSPCFQLGHLLEMSSEPAIQ